MTWHNFMWPIAHFIVIVDRHLKAVGYVGQSHLSVNRFQMI